MNKFLCSLACTWMTMINSQFYIIDGLSLDVYWNEMLTCWLPDCICLLLVSFAIAYLHQTSQDVTANS